MAVISLDTTSQYGSGSTGNVYFWSHTLNANATILLVFATGAGTVLSVDVDGIGLTNYSGSGTDDVQIWYLLAPPTGARTITVHQGGGGGSGGTGLSASYLGVGGVDSFSKHNVSGHGGSTITQNTTVVASNCWVVGGGFGITNGGFNIVSFTTVTNRQSVTFAPGNSRGMAIGDSNGTVGTGTQGLTFTSGYSDNFFGAAVMSLFPGDPRKSNGMFMTLD